MSYFGSLSDAKAAINSVEMTTEGKSSNLLHGSNTPGVKNKAAGETQEVGRLRTGIKHPKTATDTLKRSD